MTSEASCKAFEALISPSAVMILALASRSASASAAMALCSCTGRRTSLLETNNKKREKSEISFQDIYYVFTTSLMSSYISTLSTSTPHGSVASSKLACIMWLIASLSDSNCAKSLMPRTLRRVVAASNLVEPLKNKIET